MKKASEFCLQIILSLQNWGLLTYRETSFLHYPDDTPTISEQRVITQLKLLKLLYLSFVDRLSPLLLMNKLTCGSEIFSRAGGGRKLGKTFS